MILTSHQIGHILAVLYDTDNLDLLNDRFIAFHLSGGTTEALLVEPHKTELIKASIIGESTDLKAGQAIDRTGLMLGLRFPCGKELEKLAEKSEKKYKPKSVLKKGSCCLSGLENQCRKMLDDGEKKEDIANFCLSSIFSAVFSMTEFVLNNYGMLPIVYAGGVMSDKIIRDKLLSRFDAFFAEPDFSCDNAVGTAVFAAIKENSL